MLKADELLLLCLRRSVLCFCFLLLWLLLQLMLSHEHSLYAPHYFYFFLSPHLSLLTTCYAWCFLIFLSVLQKCDCVCRVIHCIILDKYYEYYVLKWAYFYIISIHSIPVEFQFDFIWLFLEKKIIKCEYMHVDDFSGSSPQFFRTENRFCLRRGWFSVWKIHLIIFRTSLMMKMIYMNENMFILVHLIADMTALSCLSLAMHSMFIHIHHPSHKITNRCRNPNVRFLGTSFSIFE